MEELKKQVTRAHRRIVFQKFLTVLAWSLFITFVIALIAIAIPKIWALGLDTEIWKYSWLGGALVAGFLIAGGWALFNRRGPLDAAIEIDKRFGLKERVSSTFSLSENELQSEIGDALVQDASRRVARLDISEQFKPKAKFFNLLPLAPAIIAFLIAVLVPDAISKQAATAEAKTIQVKKQIQKSTEELKKKWAKQRKMAEEKNLPAAKLLGELEKGVDQLNKKDVDKKKALVKLNDLAKEIKKRKDLMGDVNKMQKQLKQMKDLKPGPAQKMNQALKEGNFSKALDELNKLTEKLTTGNMSKKETEQLAKQMNQMAQKLQQMAQAQQDAKEQLKKQIADAKKAGDNAKAGQLQQKLDKMNAQSQQMKKLQQLAKQCEACSKAAQQASQQAAKNGQQSAQAKQASQQAAQEMQKLAEQLESMKGELEQMEMLDEAMDELADAKDRMNCSQCNGEGCEACQGSMGGSMGSMASRIPGGQGMGDGQGVGDRLEAETDKNFYESRVRAKIGKGKSVTTGFANGKNIAGEALEGIKEALEVDASDASDPLTDVKLPKEHRDHAREYFDSFNPE